MATESEIRSFQDFYKSIFDNIADGLAYCQMFFDIQGNPIDFTYTHHTMKRH